MTENKRFELTYFDCDYITDHSINVDYPVVDKKSMFKIVDLLNELHEENLLLKGEVAHYKLILMSLEEEAKRISQIR